MTMSKSMHTLLVEYAMLVDLKAQAPQLQTVPHELTQVNITVIAVFIFPTYAKITHIHTIN